MVSAKGKLRSGLRWREGSARCSVLNPNTLLYARVPISEMREGRERFGGRSAPVAPLEHPLVVEETLARCDGYLGEIRMRWIEEHIRVSPDRDGREFEGDRSFTPQPFDADRLALPVVDLVPVAWQTAWIEFLDLVIRNSGLNHHQVVGGLGW